MKTHFGGNVAMPCVAGDPCFGGAGVSPADLLLLKAPQTAGETPAPPDLPPHIVS